MPEVRKPLPRRLGLVSPGVGGAVQASPCSELPLRLGRERALGPRGVRLRVLVGDVDDRVVFTSVERAARALGMAPARTRRPRPPLAEVPEVDRAGRGREDQRARHEVLDGGTRVVGRVERALGDAPYILGAEFSAADIMLGFGLGMIVTAGVCTAVFNSSSSVAGL